MNKIVKSQPQAKQSASDAPESESLEMIVVERRERVGLIILNRPKA